MAVRLLMLLVLGAGLVGCGRSSEEPIASSAGSQPVQADSSYHPPFRNVNTNTAFVGDAACASCHGELHESYQTHGMAQSFYALTPENAVEDFSQPPLFHEATGLYYRMVREGDQFFQEEYLLDEAGRKTHQLRREMEYVVGSGTAARTYLTVENGRFHEMPVTWYTQEERWDFSPGYEVHNARFNRLIRDQCIACHNSYPESVPFVEGKYTSMPSGIGCERCHGPGALHVQARQEAPLEEAIDYTIVNPKHLPLERRLDLCSSCHVHSDVSLLREGREPFDFRPGEALADHVALFSNAQNLRPDAVGVNSHADRMKASPCFVATRDTSEPMDCMTCHDPHVGFRAMDPVAYNEPCLQCHDTEALAEQLEGEAESAHEPGADCVTCHMPRVEVSDAPHASFTDHWIRVVRDVPEVQLAKAHAPVRLEPYFERDEETAEGAVYTGVAYVAYGNQQGDSAIIQQGIDSLSQVLDTQSEIGEAQFLLGWARHEVGDSEEAIPSLEEAVRERHDVPERLNALAQAYERAGRDPVRIARLYTHALEVQPARADIRVNYGRFLESQGQLDEALIQYRRAAEERPWLAVAHFNMGTALMQRGDVDGAEAALKQAIQLEPKSPTMLGNLGSLYAQQGDERAARRVFERAVEVAPNHYIALGNLGTFYLNTGETQAAISYLQRAVELEPEYVTGLANLALAYFRDDQMGEARRYAERALEQAPSHPLAQQILAAL